MQSVSIDPQGSVSVFLQSSTSTTVTQTAPPIPTSNCGICFEEFQIVDNPRQAASTPDPVGKGKAAAPLEFGVVLTCSKDHGFCIECLTMYVKSKLQDGKASEGRGFPIRCPGCDQKTARWEVDDELAEKVLDEEVLEFWRRQKLLLSLPGMIYCPSSRCSELLEAPEEQIAGALECPYCTCSICFECKSFWHPDLTCKENEALKEHEDKEIYIMAKTQNWRRCPKCSVIVEKNEGCHHMTCRCGYEFCWLCGKVYGSGGCAGNCGEWVRDPNVIALPRPGQAVSQSGPSTTRIEPSITLEPHFRRRAPPDPLRAMQVLMTRRGPQRSGLPDVAHPSWLPPWSR